MRKTGKRSRRSADGHPPKPIDIDAVLEDGTAIDRAVRQATREAVLQHKRAGNPIAVWSRGKVVWIKPEDI